jgi:hypothetical protein
MAEALGRFKQNPLLLGQAMTDSTAADAPTSGKASAEFLDVVFFGARHDNEVKLSWDRCQSIVDLLGNFPSRAAPDADEIALGSGAAALGGDEETSAGFFQVPGVGLSSSLPASGEQ